MPSKVFIGESIVSIKQSCVSNKNCSRSQGWSSYMQSKKRKFPTYTVKQGVLWTVELDRQDLIATFTKENKIKKDTDIGKRKVQSAKSCPVLRQRVTRVDNYILLSSTSTCVAMPAWSQPGFQRAILPFILWYLVSASSTLLVRAWPRCSLPVDARLSLKLRLKII